MDERAAREARRALMRLRRAVEKAARELETVENALRTAGGGDVPAQVFEEAAHHLLAVAEFIDEQDERLQTTILEAGGIDPERLRRDVADWEDEA
jgi:hypothetical protein